MTEQSISSTPLASEVVENTLQYLEENGWCQNIAWTRAKEGSGGLEPDDGTPACIVGGLRITTKTFCGKVSPYGPLFDIAFWEIAKDLPRSPRTGDHSQPAGFNDFVATSFEDVRNQLMKTAKRLRDEGR